MSENIDVVQRGIAAKGLTPFETGGSTPPPPAENDDAPDVVRSRIDRPIDLGSDQANLEEATRQRRREWESDSPPDMGTEEQPTIARQKAGIIERRIQADYEPARTAQTGLREITQALSDQHILETPEANFVRQHFGMGDEEILGIVKNEDYLRSLGYSNLEAAEYSRRAKTPDPKPTLANERTGIRQPIGDHERILFDAG